MDRVYKYIIENTSTGKIDRQVAIQLLTDLKGQESQLEDDIAIIGMAVKLPSAQNADDFWANLENGRDCIREFPESRRKDIDNYLYYTDTELQEIRYIKGGFLDNIDEFDYKFFHFSPKEASLMDPCQRLFLQTTWQAIEDAGYCGEKLIGSKTGVYVGFATTLKDNYQKIIYDVEPSSVPVSIVATLPAMIPTRLSYMLDLKGPTMVIDTACSSTLVAVHLACQGIKSGECDMAIAGGVKIHTIPLDNEHMKLGIESSDGRTKAFDDSSDGTGIGEGVGAVLLKQLKKALKDRDNIYAVIKGTAINQDGKSIGITAPNPVAQADVIVNAWKNAGINPETITYIQAHGTGTDLGDPIEIDGLKRAFEKYTNKKQFCAIGSVKTNIGHLYEGAGIINLISAVLSLKNRQIPPSLHFVKPNRKIKIENTPIYINDRLTQWETDGYPRRCGVSSFGFSGTNCHIVLEESPNNIENSENSTEKPWIFTISAQSGEVLKELLVHYNKWLSGNPTDNLSNICFTANTGRSHYSHRIAFVTTNKEEFKEKIHKLSSIDIETENGQGYFYGKHKVISSTGAKKGGENQQDEIKELSGLAKSKQNEFFNTGSKNNKLLEEICSLYSRGATVDWEEFFKNESVKRVRLPVYPFEKNRCWIEVPQARSRNKKPGEDELYYSFSWKQKAIAETRIWPKDDAVLLFTDGKGMGGEIAAKLNSEGRKVIRVNLGTNYQKNDADAYVIENREEDYEKLLADIKGIRLTQIIHTLSTSRDNEIMDLHMLEYSQSVGVISLFYLAKALQKAGIKNNIEIVLVTRCAYKVDGFEKDIRPEYATLVGLGKVIGTETPNIKCKNIDIDAYTDINQVITELSSDCNGYQIAYRKGKRYVEEIGRIDSKNINDRSLVIKDNGVYIITGGTGGIGLEIAKFFASKARVNLALINRTPIPDKNLWDTVLAKGDNKKLCNKINAIREIENSGSIVECYSVDISNALKVESMLKELRKKYGGINGIVHSAGIAGEGFIIGRDIEAFKSVLSPKVQGTWILDKLTENDKMDFFVLFSSGASVLGGPGQGDYTAANAYLDSFVDYRRKKNKRTVVINWVAWKETGMAVDHGTNHDTIFKAIPTYRAIKGFEEVMNKDISRVLIGELNYNSKIGYILDKLPFDLSDEIRYSIENYKLNKELEQAANTAHAKQQVILKGREQNENYTEIEKVIGNICKDVLGFKEIDIYENFFDLGGDSMLMVKMHAEIDRIFPARLTISDMFSHSSIARLAEFLAKGQDKKKVAGRPVNNINNNCSRDIAIIGIAGRFPMADDVHAFWRNLVGANDCIIGFPESRKNDIDSYVKKYIGFEKVKVDYAKGAFLEEIDKFDFRFFRIPPKEAAFMDPNQRLFLEVAWEAMEDAGYGGDRIVGSKTGVYVGFAKTTFDYDRLISDMYPSLYTGFVVGNLASIIPSRLAYLMNLKGPTAVVDTACSSALVAVHMACRGILNGDCDMAFAGGVKINLIPFKRDKENGIGIESPDDRARTFDETAEGTGIGEGVGVVLLKPLSKALEDNDNIYAVIKGSAVNQDGASAGLTAPNSLAQADVLSTAWEDAGISPETISYLEAHGTGTKLGDPIEIDGIQKAFKRYTDKKQFCAIGSVKTNIAHLYEGAGIASLIKGILTLKNKQIPASIHFITPNRKINFEESPVYLNTKLKKLESRDFPLRCAVSAFGFSGTNCHIVLEEGPTIEGRASGRNGYYIFTISAKSKKSLKDTAASFVINQDTWVNHELRDICYTQNTGRGHYNHRVAGVIKEKEELLKILKDIDAGIDKLNEITGVFYKEHSILSGGVIEGQINIISQEERRDLNRKASEIIETLAATQDYSMDKLQELCRLYVGGANIHWEKLYENEDARRVSLPAYRFEKERCWLDMPKTGISTMNCGGEGFYSLEWQQEIIENSNSIAFKVGSVLVFKDECGCAPEVIKALRERGNTVIEVVIGKKYKNLDLNSYEVGICQEDYMKLMETLRGVNLTHIVHMSSIRSNNQINSLEDLEKTQEYGLYSLFNIIKSIMAKCPDKNINMTLISRYTNKVDGSEPVILPENATMFGLGKVVNKEYPNLRCRSIDIDTNTEICEIIPELVADNGIYQTAYRSGKRYVEVFKECDLSKMKYSMTEIKDSGVYIITGGTGGIGLEMAKFLASKRKVNIALINRSEMPVRELWDEILERGEDGKLRGKIKVIRDIESTGTEVICYSTDISDFDKVKLVVDELRHKFGKINGIIHCAGIPSNKLLADKSEQELKEILSPKLWGTWILNRLTWEDDLDFFVMFSSVATVFSAQGQGDYVAANSYIDSFTDYRSSSGKKTLSINWVTWREVGMAVDSGFVFDAVFKAIGTERAVKSFEDVLNRNISRVLIGEINYENRIAQTIKKSPFRISEGIASKLSAYTGSIKDKMPVRATDAGVVELIGKKDGEKYNEIEMILRQVCMEEFGFEEISVNDNFFELGGDSIGIARMRNRLNELIPDKISITDIFEYPTISKLAQYITSLGNTDENAAGSSKRDVEKEVACMVDEMEKGKVTVDQILENLKDI